MSTKDLGQRLERWAHLRFSIIGGLLASPPKRGQLRAELQRLAGQRYRHPSQPGGWISFGVSTLERWYYRAVQAADPVKALGRRVRNDRGRARVMSALLLAALETQYRDHRAWSYQLHFDNLTALVQERPELGPVPSYTTVRRRMQQHGWRRMAVRRGTATAGRIRAIERLEKREVRSFEATHNHALWHFDFHSGHLRVVDALGQWHTPIILGILDDRSRLCCHAQWYLEETAENLIHGLCQAYAKRGLPRSEMSDNGGAMIAAETQNGVKRLGIQPQFTLPFSPFQNGKQEVLWGQVEGRCMAMLDGVKGLTLSFLNRATQAWVELEYNRKRHSELGCSPLERLLAEPDVARPAPDFESMRLAFTRKERRTQRRSDGTISVHNVRFEVPSRFRHARRLHVRFQSWDLKEAYLVDEHTDDLLARIRPLDKTRNANGHRRSLAPVGENEVTRPAATESVSDRLPPLMRRLLADHAATGLPPAYLPKDDLPDDEPQNQ